MSSLSSSVGGGGGGPLASQSLSGAANRKRPLPSSASATTGGVGGGPVTGTAAATATAVGGAGVGGAAMMPLFDAVYVGHVGASPHSALECARLSMDESSSYVVASLAHGRVALWTLADKQLRK